MYRIDNLTIEDIIFLEYSLFLYEQRLENEIIEVKIRIDKATKENNTDDYKIYAHMLETKQASIIKCHQLSNILQGVKAEGTKNV